LSTSARGACSEVERGSMVVGHLLLPADCSQDAAGAALRASQPCGSGRTCLISNNICDTTLMCSIGALTLRRVYVSGVRVKATRRISSTCCICAKGRAVADERAARGGQN